MVPEKEMIQEIMNPVKINLSINHFVFFVGLFLCFACAEERTKEQITVPEVVIKNNDPAKESKPVLIVLNDSIKVKLKGDACTDCYAKEFAFSSVHNNSNADKTDSLLIPVAREKFLLDCIFTKTKYIAETKQKLDEPVLVGAKISAFTEAEKKKLAGMADSINRVRNKMLEAMQTDKGAEEELAFYEKLRKKVLTALRENYCSQVYRIRICACAPGHYPDHYMEGVYKRLERFICRTDYKKLNKELREMNFANEEHKERLRLQLKELSLKPYTDLKY